MFHLVEGILEGDLAQNFRSGDAKLEQVYDDAHDELYTTAWEQRASNPRESAPGIYVGNLVDTCRQERPAANARADAECDKKDTRIHLTRQHIMNMPIPSTTRF
jgi:hypothetical protein